MLHRDVTQIDLVLAKDREWGIGKSTGTIKNRLAPGRMRYKKR
jgi:hypothetical protein